MNGVKHGEGKVVLVDGTEEEKEWVNGEVRRDE